MMFLLEFFREALIYSSFRRKPESSALIKKFSLLRKRQNRIN